MRARCLALCLTAVTSVGLPSQSTHLVGPGGLAEIRDALAIATPDDIILVDPGTYAHFEVPFGVTIRAVVEGTVQVDIDSAFLPPNCVVDPVCWQNGGVTEFSMPPDHVAHIVGIDFLGGFVFVGLGRANHRVRVLGGTVSFDNCTIEATERPAIEANNANLFLVDTVVRGLLSGSPADGLRALAANVVAVNCSFTGSTGSAQGIPGHGVILGSSSLNGSNLTMQGGPTQSTAPPAAGLRANVGSEIWLSDSSLTGGAGPGGQNACGLDVPGAVGRLERCTVGLGSGTCTLLPVGNQLAIDRPVPLETNVTFVLDYRTVPNGAIAIRLSDSLVRRTFSFLEQPWWAPDADVGTAFVVADSLGAAQKTWLVPNDPYFVNKVVWFHSVGLSTNLPLPVAPVVGGVIR